MPLFSTRLLIEWLLKDFWKISAITTVFAVASVIYVLGLPNTYGSRTKVSSNLTDTKSMGGALSSLGGLASLAGISLGGGTLSPEVLKETISANSFLAAFIRHKGIEKEIIAAEDFNPDKNEFIYDDKLYDVNSNLWIRDYKYPQTLVPSDAELVEKFKESLSFSYERKTKLIVISFTSFSPQFSQTVIQDMVAYFNVYMRNRDMIDFESSVKYLKSELNKATYSEVKYALQQIMEEQYKKLALAKTREEYALRFIESPMIAAKKSGPKRAVICIGITLLGLLFSIISLFSYRIMKKQY